MDCCSPTSQPACAFVQTDPKTPFQTCIPPTLSSASSSSPKVPPSQPDIFIHRCSTSIGTSLSALSNMCDGCLKCERTASPVFSIANKPFSRAAHQTTVRYNLPLVDSRCIDNGVVDSDSIMEQRHARPSSPKHSFEAYEDSPSRPAQSFKTFPALTRDFSPPQCWQSSSKSNNKESLIPNTPALGFSEERADTNTKQHSYMDDNERKDMFQESCFNVPPNNIRSWKPFATSGEYKDVLPPVNFAAKLVTDEVIKNVGNSTDDVDNEKAWHQMSDVISNKNNSARNDPGRLSCEQSHRVIKKEISNDVYAALSKDVFDFNWRDIEYVLRSENNLEDEDNGIVYLADLLNFDQVKLRQLRPGLRLSNYHESGLDFQSSNNPDNSILLNIVRNERSIMKNILPNFSCPTPGSCQPNMSDRRYMAMTASTVPSHLVQKQSSTEHRDSLVSSHRYTQADKDEIAIANACAAPCGGKRVELDSATATRENFRQEMIIRPRCLSIGVSCSRDSTFNLYTDQYGSSLPNGMDASNDGRTSKASESSSETQAAIGTVSKRRTKNRPRTQPNQCLHLWEFLANLLNCDQFCPRFICWTREDVGEFKLNRPEDVANFWGQSKKRKKMTYEKMARALRYYYKHNVLEKVPHKRLHFRFGSAILQHIRRNYNCSQSSTGITQKNEEFNQEGVPACHFVCTLVQGSRPKVRARISGLRNVFSGTASQQTANSNFAPSSPSMPDEEDGIVDSLNADELVLTKVGRYGFPYQATCLALDPLQKLLAIGTANGGGLISACDDASIHLWNLRQAQPALIQSLRFNREKITCIRLPYTSKWLYVGTERGNVYMVCVETFKISGYVISWNKAIEVSCKTHPGPVLEIETNPVDENKLLITFESGTCVLWDLRSKAVQQRYTMSKDKKQISCCSWHMEGKQFITGHWDGSISTWNWKNSKNPEETNTPHASKQGPFCSSISKLAWYSVKEGDPCIVIFSGGLAQGNNKKGLTLLRGRSKMLLLSDFVIDFVCLSGTPWRQGFQAPQIVITLLKNEIVVFDLSTLPAPSLPWFEIPYTFGIHDSPITCLQYYPECPADLIPALMHSFSSIKKTPSGAAKQKWLITGGELGEVSYESSLLVTGHADGSCKFWDVSSNSLYLVYKLNVSDLFERTITRSDSTCSDGSKGSAGEHFSEDSNAIQHIQLCTRSRVLVVSTLSNSVVVYKFRTKETASELSRVEVNFGIEVGCEYDDSPTDSQPTSPPHYTMEDPASSQQDPMQLSRGTSVLSTTSTVKAAMHKWSTGYQPELVCQQIANEPAPSITCVTLSSAYGLLAFGNALGIALVDYIQKKLVTVMMSYEIGVMGDIPDQSGPESAKAQKVSSPEADGADRTDAGENSKEKKKDRSRFFTDLKDHRDQRDRDPRDHPKLAKRLSSMLNGKDKDKPRDREDGIFKGEIPMAGTVSSLLFTYSYTRKGANIIVPSLWVGTSTGSTSVSALSMPSNGEQRLLQPVLVHNSGTQLNLKSCVLTMSLLNKNGCLYPSPFEFWKDSDDSKTSLSTLPMFTIESSEKHYLVLVSERKIKIKSLPSLKTISKTKQTDQSFFFIKADVFEIEGSSCIGLITSTGSIIIYGLPSLRLLLHNDCGFNAADYRAFKTFRFGKGGEAVYLVSPTEIQRIALTKKKQSQYIEGLGSLFTVVSSPEPPQKGFFQNLFSSTPSPLDKEELFGSKKVGTASKSVADRVPGSGIEGLKNNSDSIIGALAGARMALDERGQKLNLLEDRTAMLSTRASAFSSAASALADKYQKKKWWQL
eukprot:gene394-1028_t